MEKYDINNDDWIDSFEKTEAYKISLKRVTNDTARIFAYISGAIYSGVVSILVLSFSLTFMFIKNLLNK